MRADFGPERVDFSLSGLILGLGAKFDLRGLIGGQSTICSNYRQMVFSITLYFLLVYIQYGPPEQESSFKKNFLVAPFEKNPKLIVFSLILKTEFLGLLEDLLR